MQRIKVWFLNKRFNLGYRIGGFISAKRDR
jgi:hypothetical protein